MPVLEPLGIMPASRSGPTQLWATSGNTTWYGEALKASKERATVHSTALRVVSCISSSGK